LDFARVLDAVAVFLEEGGFPFAVCGAFALQAYGLARATQDLDFVVPLEAQEQLVAFMESRGYETLHRSRGFSNHLHADPERGRVDFIYVHGSTSRKVFAEARPYAIAGGVQVRVPSPEHLVAMKVQAMKEDPTRTFKEMADLEFLLRVPGIREDAVRSHFERHGLLERFHELKRLSG
jgi:predicted nucleotidyltransferase